LEKSLIIMKMVGWFNVFKNIMKYITLGLGVVVSFIPGLQPVGALLGVASGAMAVADGVTNLVENHQKGTSTGWNTAANIIEIVGGVIAPIGAVASAAEGVVAQGITKAVNVVGDLKHLAQSVVEIGEHVETGTSTGINQVANAFGIMSGLVGPIGDVGSSIAKGISGGLYAVDQGLQTLEVAGDTVSDLMTVHRISAVETLKTKTVNSQNPINIQQTQTYGNMVGRSNSNIYSQNTVLGPYDFL
jgi:hypothetical protein